MCQLDERILEYIEIEGWTSPRLLASRFSASQQRFRDRCHVLANAELSEPFAGEQYELTVWGIQYLDGEVDTHHRRPIPAPKPPGKVRPGWWFGGDWRNKATDSPINANDG
jgi:hypothetical protein